jgi:hypothetical protein
MGREKSKKPAPVGAGFSGFAYSDFWQKYQSLHS